MQEGADIRRREEARFIEYTVASQEVVLAGKGVREKQGVALTMNRDEGRRDELERRKKETLSQVQFFSSENAFMLTCLDKCPIKIGHDQINTFQKCCKLCLNSKGDLSKKGTCRLTCYSIPKNLGNEKN